MRVTSPASLHLHYQARAKVWGHQKPRKWASVVRERRRDASTFQSTFSASKADGAGSHQGSNASSSRRCSEVMLDAAEPKRAQLYLSHTPQPSSTGDFGWIRGLQGRQMQSSCSPIKPSIRFYSKTAEAVARADTVEDSSTFTSTHASVSDTLSSTSQHPAVRQASQLRNVIQEGLGGDEGRVWTSRLGLALESIAAATRGEFSVKEGEKVASGRGKALAVFGDQLADPAGVVTSLLLDPFDENAQVTRSIKERLTDREARLKSAQTSKTSSFSDSESVFRIRMPSNSSMKQTDEARRGLTELECGAPWLRDAGVEVWEIDSMQSQDTLNTILTTPYTLLALDPIRLLDTEALQSILPELGTKSNVYIVVNGPYLSHSSATHSSTKLKQDHDEVLNRLSKQWRNVPGAGDMPRTFFLDSTKAVTAMEDLQAGLTGDRAEDRASALSRFQENYDASGLGAFSQGFLGDLRGRDRQEDMLATLEHLSDRAGSFVSRKLSELQSEVDQAIRVAERLEDSAIKVASEYDRLTAPEALIKHLVRSREEVQNVLRDRLAWWKILVWRMDQVADELGAEVNGRWGQALSQELAFLAGRLESSRISSSDQVERTLKRYSRPDDDPHGSGAPFYSPVFLNALDQISSRTQLYPTSLSGPIEHRRDQLLRSALPILQRRAHQVTWTTWSLIFGSSSLAWTASVPLELISGYTGTGLGLLGSLAGLRWAAGRWAKFGKTFTRDWGRIEEGLVDDIKESVKDAVEQKVVAKNVAAGKGLRMLAERQSQRIESVEQQVKKRV